MDKPTTYHFPTDPGPVEIRWCEPNGGREPPAGYVLIEKRSYWVSSLWEPAYVPSECAPPAKE